MARQESGEIDSNCYNFYLGAQSPVPTPLLAYPVYIWLYVQNTGGVRDHDQLELHGTAAAPGCQLQLSLRSKGRHLYHATIAFEFISQEVTWQLHTFSLYALETTGLAVQIQRKMAKQSDHCPLEMWILHCGGSDLCCIPQWRSHN